MAGWRVGYMVMPEHLDQAVKKIQDTNLICPPILNQRAAAAALNAGKAWCLPHAADLGPVRDQALDELARLGDRVDIPRPGGAFYMMVRVHTKRTDLELVEGLIRDFGVAVLPGSTFGVQSGCLLRIAFGASGRIRWPRGSGGFDAGWNRSYDPGEVAPANRRSNATSLPRESRRHDKAKSQSTKSEGMIKTRERNPKQAVAERGLDFRFGFVGLLGSSCFGFILTIYGRRAL